MKQRGSALLIALFIAVLLFVAGIGLVFLFRVDYNLRFQAAQWTQARALAEAGLEDFRVKLERDVHFPPDRDVEQTIFEYTEQISQSADLTGGFQIQSDVSLRKRPWNLVLVTSTGFLGSPDRPRVRVSLQGEFDVASLKRGTTTPNPRAFQFRQLTRNLLNR